MIGSSTREFVLILIRAGRPASWCAISRSILAIRPPRRECGRDQQPPVGGVVGVAGQVDEQVRDVLADQRVGGEQAEVLVVPGGLGVVVARADVAVAAQLAGRLLPYDQGQLAVGLEPDDAVDDVAAGLLQLARPGDVGVLVEAGLDLHDHDDLLARLGRVDQRVHDRGVAAGPVERLLDRQDVRVVGGLPR